MSGPSVPPRVSPGTVLATCFVLLSLSYGLYAWAEAGIDLPYGGPPSRSSPEQSPPGKSSWDGRVSACLEAMIGLEKKFSQNFTARPRAMQDCSDLGREDRAACEGILEEGQEVFRLMEEHFSSSPELDAALGKPSPVLRETNGSGGWLQLALRVRPVSWITDWEVARRSDAGELRQAARLAWALWHFGALLEHGTPEGRRHGDTAAGRNLQWAAVSMLATLVLRGEPAELAATSVTGPLEGRSLPVLPFAYPILGERDESRRLLRSARESLGLRLTILDLVHGSAGEKLEAFYRDMLRIGDLPPREALEWSDHLSEGLPESLGHPLLPKIIPRLGELALKYRKARLREQVLPLLPEVRRLRDSGRLDAQAFSRIPGLPEDPLGTGSIRLVHQEDRFEIVFGGGGGQDPTWIFWFPDKP